MIEGEQMNYNILIADDEEHILLDYESKLVRHLDINTTFVSSPEEVIEIYNKNIDKYAVVVLDYNYRDSNLNGASLAKKIKAVNPKQAILICSGLNDQDPAIESFKAGAVDFIKKGCDVSDIVEKIRSHFKKYDETRRVLDFNTSKKARLTKNSNLISKIGLVGQSDSLAEVAKQIGIISDYGSNSTVLIRGESGTGKELLAKAVHKFSSRSNKMFLPINCGAIPKDLLESELFGHEKGSFTGAVTKKIGKFQLANGGTIFLDEIGDLDRQLQVKLLRVLQEGTIEPIGSNSSMTVDVKIIAATHVNLEDAIERGDFREDLYYRLNVIPLTVAPLRQRLEDIEPLVLHFMEKHPNGKDKKFLYKTIQYLKSYPWRGNVRELENIVNGLLTMTLSNEIRPEHLSEDFFVTDDVQFEDFKGSFEELKIRLQDYSDKVQKDYILKKIRNLPTPLSFRTAAEKINISKSSLKRKLDSWGYSSKEVFNDGN